MASLAAELERAERIVENIEDLEEAKSDIEENEHPNALEAIERVQDRLEEEVPDIRVRVAADLLTLSPPTVRKWIERGLLEKVESERVRVTLQSVLEIRPLVLRLRELGQRRNLLDAVFARIDDEATVADPEVRESIAELEAALKAGRVDELTEITPTRTTGGRPTPKRGQSAAARKGRTRRRVRRAA